MIPNRIESSLNISTFGQAAHAQIGLPATCAVAPGASSAGRTVLKTAESTELRTTSSSGTTQASRGSRASGGVGMPPTKSGENIHS